MDRSQICGRLHDLVQTDRQLVEQHRQLVEMLGELQYLRNLVRTAEMRATAKRRQIANEGETCVVTPRSGNRRRAYKDAC